MNSKYMLGIDAEGTNPRVMDCFQATKEKHGQILQSAQGKTARAILAYFEKWDPEKAAEHPMIRENWEELTEGGNLIFSVEGQEAQDDPEIRDCWENYRAQNGGEDNGICLVTGKKAEISRIHKAIKGVLGMAVPVELHWCHSMHRHLSLTERNRVIMHRWENMRNLPIPLH